MLTLERARRSSGQAGEPIPTVFPQLEAEGAHLARRGQLTLLAAGPGTGKSALALAVAIKSGIPALYLSADSDAFTQYVRTAAMLTGYRTDDVEKDVHADRATHYDTTITQRLGHLRFDFNASPTLADIDDEVTAYAHTFGEYPALVVLDNLSNVYDETGSSSPFAGYEASLEFLHELGRNTGAAVLALHHLTADYDDGSTPAPMSALRGKVSKIPETIITAHRVGSFDYGNTQLGLSMCKQRAGRADPSGRWVIHIPVNLDRMHIG